MAWRVFTEGARDIAALVAVPLASWPIVTVESAVGAPLPWLVSPWAWTADKAARLKVEPMSPYLVNVRLLASRASSDSLRYVGDNEVRGGGGGEDAHLIFEKVTLSSGVLARMSTGFPAVALHGPDPSLSSPIDTLH